MSGSDHRKKRNNTSLHALRFVSSVPGDAKIATRSPLVVEEQLWVDKYSPSENELAVHAKKVTEVREWLARSLQVLRSGVPNAPRLLVLLGPPGCGKTAVVRAVAASQRCEVIEWTNTVHVAGQWSRGSTDDVRLESRTEEFRGFVLRATAYPTLAMCESPGPEASAGDGTAESPMCLDDSDTTTSGRRVQAPAPPSAGSLLLLEDLPNLASEDQREGFRSLLMNCAARSRCPVVLVLSDERSGRAPTRDYVGDAVLRHPGTTVVRFREVAPTFVEKALKRVRSAQRAIVSDETLAQIAETCGGDIRNAVNTLQFYASGPLNGTAVAPAASAKRGTKPRRGKAKGGADKASDTARGKDDGGGRGEQESACGRDVSHSLLHAVGKVLHIPEKRVADPSAPFDPVRVLLRTAADAPVITSFLHQNYLPYFMELDDVVAASVHLSEAAALSANWEQQEVMDSYAALVAMWGLAGANLHPAPARWSQVYRPDEFRVGRATRRTSEETLSAFAELAGRTSRRELFCELLPHMAMVPPWQPSPRGPLLAALRSFSQPRQPARLPHGHGEALGEHEGFDDDAGRRAAAAPENDPSDIQDVVDEILDD